MEQTTAQRYSPYWYFTNYAVPHVIIIHGKKRRDVSQKTGNPKINCWVVQKPAEIGRSGVAQTLLILFTSKSSRNTSKTLKTDNVAQMTARPAVW